MNVSAEQIAELKRYCATVKLLVEGGVSLFLLETLRLPQGCSPSACDALLCPVPRDGYPSRLYVSALVKCPGERNWNVTNARIGERNWFAFSWRVEPLTPTLAGFLTAHLIGFTR